MSLIRRLLILWGVGALSLFSFAEEMIFPNTNYDEGVPSLQSVLGFRPGEKMAMHHEAVHYITALASASDKVVAKPHGKSWEGREMVLVFISAPENLKRLENFKTRYQDLASGTEIEADRFNDLTADLPVLVWLSESVHGNELSGVDSGLFLTWHLAASKGDKDVDAVLKNAVVVIELMQNPDGRDRFIQHSRFSRGPGGNPDPQDVQHLESWPPARYNHYLFDMNRDWFALTQVETRVKVAAYLEWFPQVVVDVHEMDRNSTFFAANPAAPSNPILSTAMTDAYKAFGKVVGAVLDQRGIDYFQGETYDSFYPGYGESWPSLQGSMGILFEQASPRGLQMRRRDGTILTHFHAVRNNSIASFAVIKHAAANRDGMLRFFHQNRMEARQGLKQIEDRYVALLPGDDPARAIFLGELLRGQGIEVEQLVEPSKVVAVRDLGFNNSRKQELPANSLLVPFNQPAGRLAWSILSDRVELQGDFLEEQNRRYERRLGAEVYDITGWSLPVAHGVEAVFLQGGAKAATRKDLKVPFSVSNIQATLGFLIPYRGNAGAALADLLQQEIKVSFTSKPIEHGEWRFPAGALMIRRQGNPADLSNRLTSLADKYKVSVVGVDSSWFDSGPGFGSNDVLPIPRVQVALLWDEPTSALSAGWLRYTVEQMLGYPLTLLKSERIERSNLKSYDVILLPDAEPEKWLHALREKGLANLKQWLKEGGVLVTVAGATELLLHQDVQLLSSAREWKGGRIAGGNASGDHPNKPVSDPNKMIEPRQEWPRKVLGAMIRTSFDTSNWMGFGMMSEQGVLVDSRRILRPLRLDAGVNVGRYVEEERLVMAGYVPSDTRLQLAHKPFLMLQPVGRGYLVAFAEEPNYRGFMRGLLPLMSNAMFFGPAKVAR